MNELKGKLVMMGIKVDGLTDKQILGVAKALNIEAPPKEHTVEVVEYTGKKSGRTAKYVKTSNYVLGVDANGKPDNAQGLFLRVEAIDQAIADLQAVKAQLKK